MKTVDASGEVLQVYQTGDRPILVLCSDGNHYICKYKQPGYSANKLVNELIGNEFSKCWGIATPPVALVVNDPIIWDDAGISHDLTAPLLGSMKLRGVFDLSNYNCDQIEITPVALTQLLIIALFDLWLANEDRTCNNYNLLYDMRSRSIVSIDYGGIFNSGIMGGPVHQLNEEDSIISSDLFDRLKPVFGKLSLNSLNDSLVKSVTSCKTVAPKILDSVPKTWSVDVQVFKNKLEELFTEDWITETWKTFNSITKSLL